LAPGRGGWGRAVKAGRQAARRGSLDGPVGWGPHTGVEPPLWGFVSAGGWRAGAWVLSWGGGLLGLVG
jgi:hypothetical protein